MPRERERERETVSEKEEYKCYHTQRERGRKFMTTTKKTVLYIHLD